MLKSILLLSKAILRDPVQRRKMMFWLILGAMVMLFLGSIFISDQWTRAHPWLTLTYYFVCGWLTLTAMLLAVMDILILRATQRAARRALEHELMKKVPPPEDEA